MTLQTRLKPIKMDLTPLIDVVFQLVIFFLVSSVFNTAPGVSLSLPEASNAEMVDVTELRVTVISETELYVNEELAVLDSLEAAIRTGAEAAGYGGPKAVLEADQSIPYQTIIRVLEALRKEGFEGVSLVVQNQRS